MWNLLLLILAGPCVLWPLGSPRPPRPEGADRLVVAQIRDLEIRWGEIRRAYAIYCQSMARRNPGDDRLEFQDFVRAYLRAVSGDRDAGPDSVSPPDFGAPPIVPGPADRRRRPTYRTARLAQAIAARGGRAGASPPDSLSWTVYPMVDLISAWEFRNLVLTGRVPGKILNQGGRLPGAGAIVASPVELHPVGAHRDDGQAAGLMPDEYSGPIAENGHYRVIRLDRRVEGRGSRGQAGGVSAASDEIPDVRVYDRLIERLGERQGWR